jgi:hypothetical protein
VVLHQTSDHLQVDGDFCRSWQKSRLQSELVNCFNNAKYKQIFTKMAFSGLIQEIMYEPKYGYFKHCLIVATGVKSDEMKILK